MNFNIDRQHLRLELEWYERLWSVHVSQFIEIPLAHIRTISTDDPNDIMAGIRAPGTFVPALIKAGTYYTQRGREFWYVTRDQACLTLELDPSEYYKRIVVNAENNLAIAQQLQSQIDALSEN